MDIFTLILEAIKGILGLPDLIKKLSDTYGFARDEEARNQFAWEMLQLIKALTDIYVTGTQIQREAALLTNRLSTHESSTTDPLLTLLTIQWDNIYKVMRLLKRFSPCIALLDNSVYVKALLLTHSKSLLLQELLRAVSRTLGFRYDDFNDRLLHNVVLVDKDSWDACLAQCAQSDFLSADAYTRELIDNADPVQIPDRITEDTKQSWRTICEHLHSQSSQDILNDIYDLTESLRHSMRDTFSMNDLIPKLFRRPS